MCWLKVRPAGAAIQSRLQPKREASELKEKKKKTPALWETVHLQHMLEKTQNKQVKIKPQPFCV